MVLVISFFAILGLKYAQLGLIAKWSAGLGKYFTGIIIAVLLIAINAVLGIVVRKISSYEKYITLTEFNSSVAKRIAFVSPIISGLRDPLGVVVEHVRDYSFRQLLNPREGNEESDVVEQWACRRRLSDHVLRNIFFASFCPDQPCALLPLLDALVN